MFIAGVNKSSAAFLIRQMGERISLDLIFMNSIGWIVVGGFSYEVCLSFLYGTMGFGMQIP